MEYDILLSIILYAYGCFYLFFGLSAIISNLKSRTNRLFLYLTLSMSIWSFAFSIAVSAPDAESSVFWLSISVFGRGVFFSLLLHFILILTKPKNFSKIKWVITPLIYVPAVINVILFGPNGVLPKKYIKWCQVN